MGRLEALCGKIRDTHHVYLKENLPRLAALIVWENGKIDPSARGAMKTIAEGFRALSGEITAHLMKEEQILFPTIIKVERALAGDPDAGRDIHCGVSPPVRQMIFEHDGAKKLLREIKTASGAIRGRGGYVPEELLSGLAQLDADLTEHIRKEEEELFPAAIRAESDFFRLQQTPEEKEVAG
jgi:regulator of cell morphogenesis and NO signaling